MITEEKGRLAAVVEKATENVKNNPDKAVVTLRVMVESVGGVRSSVTAQSSNPMSFDVPAAPSMGLGCSIENKGQDFGMVPAEMYLASIGACMMSAVAVYGDILEIDIDRANVVVSGDLDMRGMLQLGDGVPVGYQKISFELNIESGADQATLQELATMVYNRSPVPATARQASEVVPMFKLNGEEFVPEVLA